ncbi:SDR family NAD(P)-dependent oxidoreductase [Nocardioides hwasunensis]|uniref:SDR family oxidoreductase n=1 Tax=Nocardioides hwasunensis TaxID=397258 RepID=A0ABR8MAK9_9ACTN|nr:SDR family oxidoreductase [Nocardioides hwasunensis]MBD3913190.1 SDR family oxidoreductase [Nocardioides hwasunensis]
MRLTSSRADERPAVVVVVGASSGIGRAVSLELATRGHHVGLLARRVDELEDAALACRSAGAGSAWVTTCDVVDDGQVADAVADARARHGRIDAVVHCAGIVTYGRIEDADAEHASQVVQTNLLGAMTVARHVVPVLREQRQGTLVLVGSLLGHIAVPGMTPYVVSKWGVRALARQLRIENVDLPGVGIVHVSPGSVDTDIYDEALDSAGAVNSPPPPMQSPEQVAAVIVRVIDRGRGRGRGGGSVQSSMVNYALIAAFVVTPRVWDRLVGPVFERVSHRGRSSAR